MLQFRPNAIKISSAESGDQLDFDKIDEKIARDVAKFIYSKNL